MRIIDSPRETPVVCPNCKCKFAFTDEDKNKNVVICPDCKEKIYVYADMAIHYVKGE